MGEDSLDHPFDQQVKFTTNEMDLIKKAGDVVEGASDKWEAWEGAYHLRRSIFAGGVAFAKLLHGLWERFYAIPNELNPSELHGDEWEAFKNDGVERTGASRQTITKYVESWSYVLVDHPELMTKPIGVLTLITPAAKAGELEAKDWKALEKANDKNAVRDIIHEIRGTQTSSGTAVKIVITPEGHLLAAKGDEPYKPFGYLTPSPDSEAGKAARQRIINAAGIIEP